METTKGGGSLVKLLRATTLALFMVFSSISAQVVEETPFTPGPAPESGAKVRRDEPQHISLDRVLEIARERAPAIAAARARVLQAEGQKFSSNVFPDPEIRAGWGQAKPPDGGPEGAENSFEVTQFLPAPWGVRARSRSGVARIQVARYEVEAVTVEVVLEAKRLFYEASVDEAQALALTEAAQDAESLRDLVARRVEAGESSEGDRLRTGVEARRTGLEARAARAKAEGERAALNRFLLGALGSEFSLSPDLDPRKLPPAPENLVQVVVSQNAAYRAALSRIEAAKWAASAERASRLPGLGVSAYKENEIDRDASGIVLGLSIPLWNRNEGAVRISRGQLAEAEAEALNLRALIEGETERLVRRDQVARELAIGYREEIIPAATEALSIARFSLEQGEASLLSWLEARRSYLEILRASYGAQLEAFLTRAELERLMGEPDVSERP